MKKINTEKSHDMFPLKWQFESFFSTTVQLFLGFPGTILYRTIILLKEQSQDNCFTLYAKNDYFDGLKCIYFNFMEHQLMEEQYVITYKWRIFKVVYKM